MKNKRLSFVLVLVMLALCMLVFAGCDEAEIPEDHTHEYVPVVTKPTCNEKGYTTHICTCGDSYVDTYVDPSGHNYSAEIALYPTLEKEGKRILTCSGCGNKVEEAIEAYSAVLPDVSEVVLAALGGNKYTLNADNSDFAALTERNGIEIDNSEITIQVGEIVLDGRGDTLKGHVKLEAGNVTKENDVETYNDVAAVYIYINGNTISVEMVPAGNQPKETYDFDANIEFYKAMAQALGTDVETLTSGMYILGELEQYVPVLVDFIEEAPMISADFVASIREVFGQFAEDIIAMETDENGNTTYTLNVEALKDLLATVDGKTVSDILDDMYGDGSAEALTTFIKGIPTKRLGEIVDAAILLCEDYEIAIEDTYFLINLMLQLAGAPADFNIEKEINDRYNMTILDLLVEANGMEGDAAAQFKASFADNLAEAVEGLLNSTIDDIYNMMAPSDPEASEPFSALEALEGLINMLGEAVKVDITFDENGALANMKYQVSAPLGMLDVTITNGADALLVVLDIQNGDKDLMDFTATANKQTGEITVDLVVRDDRYKYVESEVEGEEGNYEYLDFGPVFDLGFTAGTVEDATMSYEVLVKAYVEELGDLQQMLDGKFRYQIAADVQRFGLEINNMQLLVGHLEETEEAPAKYGARILMGDQEILHAWLSYKEELSADNELTGYRFEGDLVVEENDMLDLSVNVDIVNVEFAVALTIREVVVDEETNTPVLKTMGTFVLDLMNIDGGKQLIFTAKDASDAIMADYSASYKNVTNGIQFNATVIGKESAEIADVTLTLTKVVDENKETYAAEYVTTINGETISGTMSLGETMLDNGAEIARILTAIQDEQTILSFADTMTMLGNLVSYAFDYEVFGNALFDGEVSLAYDSDENKDTLTFTYDIAKLTVGMSTYTDDEDNTVQDIYAIQGKGGLVFTIEY